WQACALSREILAGRVAAVYQDQPGVTGADSRFHKPSRQTPSNLTANPIEPDLMSQAVLEPSLPQARSTGDIGMSGQVTLDALDLAALLCSRVCHDLISPTGAIVNGLEALAEKDSDGETKTV